MQSYNVVAYNAPGKAEAAFNVSRPEVAADAALKLVTAYKYVTVRDGDWKLVFTKRAGTNKPRLAHIIAMHANVALN